jgi:hypothetical protein
MKMIIQQCWNDIDMEGQNYPKKPLNYTHKLMRYLTSNTMCPNLKTNWWMLFADKIAVGPERHTTQMQCVNCQFNNCWVLIVHQSQFTTNAQNVPHPTKRPREVVNGFTDIQNSLVKCPFIYNCSWTRGFNCPHRSKSRRAEVNAWSGYTSLTADKDWYEPSSDVGNSVLKFVQAFQIRPV